MRGNVNQTHGSHVWLPVSIPDSKYVRLRALSSLHIRIGVSYDTVTTASNLPTFSTLRQMQHSFSDASASSKGPALPLASAAPLCRVSPSQANELRMSSTSRPGRRVRHASRQLSVILCSLPMRSCLCWSQHATRSTTWTNTVRNRFPQKAGEIEAFRTLEI